MVHDNKARRVAPRLVWVLGLAALLLAGCGGGPGSPDDPADAAAGLPGSGTATGGTQPPPPPPPPGTTEYGVLVHINQGGRRFTVWAKDPTAVATLMEISAGTTSFDVIAGPIRTGWGDPPHNQEWGWHLDPDLVYVNQPTDPLVRYAGTPLQVQLNLAALVASGMHKVTGSGDSVIEAIQVLTGPPPGIQPTETPLPR